LTVKLSIKQLQALPFLLDGMKQKDVAEIVGVAPETISDWLNKDQVFQEEFAKLKHEMYESLFQLASSVLSKQMTTGTELEKFKAANAFYRHHALITIRQQAKVIRLEGVEKIRELLRQDTTGPVKPVKLTAEEDEDIDDTAEAINAEFVESPKAQFETGK